MNTNSILPYTGNWFTVAGKSTIYTYSKPFTDRYNGINYDFIHNGRFALRLV